MRADAIVIVFGKFLDDGAGEDRHVTRRYDLLVGRQAIRIDEVGLSHADAGRMPVHLVGKVFDRAPYTFRNYHRDVIGGFHHQHLSALSTVTVVPGGNPS